jgi:hypothetical protein
MPFGRYRHRWEDNTKINLKRIDLQGIEWIHVALDRGKWWTRNEPSSPIKGGEFIDYLSDY